VFSRSLFHRPVRRALREELVALEDESADVLAARDWNKKQAAEQRKSVRRFHRGKTTVSEPSSAVNSIGSAFEAPSLPTFSRGAFEQVQFGWVVRRHERCDVHFMRLKMDEIRICRASRTQLRVNITPTAARTQGGSHER
jgi:hypothetical protein